MRWGEHSAARIAGLVLIVSATAGCGACGVDTVDGADQGRGQQNRNDPQGAARADNESRSTKGAEPAANPPAELQSEPFDFWRVITELEAHVGQPRICVARQVSEIKDVERYVHPGHRDRAARMVRCRRTEKDDARVVVTVSEGHTVDEIVASESNRRAPDVEVRLLLRVIGLDVRGETPNAELVRVSRTILDGPDDPTQPPSRCCRDRRGRGGSDRDKTPHFGFDFGTWTEHVGTEKLCVVGHETEPQRVDEQHRPVVRAPPGTAVQFYASCRSEQGTKHLRLLFPPETVTYALRVRRGAFVRGTITKRGNLWVRRVSAARDENRIMH